MSLNLLPRGSKLLPHLKGLILLTPKTRELRNLVDLVMVNHLVSDPLFSSAHIFPVCIEDWVSFGENHICKFLLFLVYLLYTAKLALLLSMQTLLDKKEQFTNQFHNFDEFAK